jgi:hypothetical protein
MLPVCNRAHSCCLISYIQHMTDGEKSKSPDPRTDRQLITVDASGPLVSTLPREFVSSREVLPFGIVLSIQTGAPQTTRVTSEVQEEEEYFPCSLWIVYFTDLYNEGRPFKMRLFVRHMETR